MWVPCGQPPGAVIAASPVERDNNVSRSFRPEGVSLTRILMPQSCSEFLPEGCSVDTMGGQSNEPILLSTGENAKELARDGEWIPDRK